MTRWLQRLFLLLLVSYLLVASIAALAGSSARCLMLFLPAAALAALLLGVKLRHKHMKFVFPAVTGVYLAWCLLSGAANSVSFGDFTGYQNRALEFAAGQLALWDVFHTKSPTTVLSYGSFVWLLGLGYRSIYVANAILWTAQSVLLYAILRSIPSARTHAPLAALLYALLPSVASFTALATSEALFIVLLLASVAVALAAARRHASWRCAAFGVLLGLCGLTRPIGLWVGASLVGFLWVTWHREGISAFSLSRRTGWILIGLALSLAPQATFNAVHKRGLVPFAHPGSAVAFISGLTQYNDFDRDDERIASATRLLQQASRARMRGSLTREGQYRMLDEAVEKLRARVLEVPFAYLRFALTTKMEVLWGLDDEILWRSVVESPHRDTLRSRRWVLRDIVQAPYLLVLLSSTVTLAWLLFRSSIVPEKLTPALLFLGVLPVLMIMLPHLVLQVKPRFHAPVMPFLAAFAAVGWREGARLVSHFPRLGKISFVID
jgi:hypothetical protein